jgi:hypothetical protein
MHYSVCKKILELLECEKMNPIKMGKLHVKDKFVRIPEAKSVGWEKKTLRTVVNLSIVKTKTCILAYYTKETINA